MIPKLSGCFCRKLWKISDSASVKPKTAKKFWNFSSERSLITDWALPVMDGIDVLYKIREDNKIKQPKFIFCSSVTDKDKIKQALDGGADDFIMRPFDEDIIGSKLAILGLL